MHLLYQQLEYFQGGGAASHDDALNAVFIQETDKDCAAARNRQFLPISFCQEPATHESAAKSRKAVRNETFLTA